jgi:hypothetical protein
LIIELPRRPLIYVLEHLIPARQLDLPHEILNDPLCLAIKHGEGVVLVLDAHIQQLLVPALHPQGAPKQVPRVQDVWAGEAEVIGEVGVVVNVAGGKDYSVDLDYSDYSKNIWIARNVCGFGNGGT